MYNFAYSLQVLFSKFYQKLTDLKKYYLHCRAMATVFQNINMG